MEEISNAEWEVMRVVWTLKKATSQEIITNLSHSQWQPATIKTLIGRLVKKNCLAAKRQQRPFVYYPLIAENTAMNQATMALFSHLCAMKKGQTIINLLKNTSLSQKDIQSMQLILQEKLQTAPKKIDCDCVVGGHNCE
ncbi:CopY/TcrY family copper transport repressor [Bombilactobacillus bombi]|uniref:CopY/TcrY family copper transport repressor n=1 Tax=Bombilactobacillus bombi TaxID=1303590 RepID=A0A3R6YS28_9LACO|nr:CopY/TcrY family copper transport repressor [Bombilactobacillus bombi]RHW50187.1 CopY/TcrY family copper transport repressor [Bombilactobacillus bombi]